jgi:hypothetical protein
MRCRIENRGQVYPNGSPADWIGDGHVTAGITCIACRKHSADLALAQLPADKSWQQIGRRMICRDCGAVGAVPNWHDRPDLYQR